MNIICRCCLKREYVTNEENATTIMYNIFEEKINEKLIKLFNMNININDLLPHTICVECKKKVEEFNSFKVLCTNSDRKLRVFYHYRNQDDGFQHYYYQSEGSVEIISNLSQKKSSITNSINAMSVISPETNNNYNHSTSPYSTSSILIDNNIKNCDFEIESKNNSNCWDELVNSSKDLIINNIILVPNFSENINEIAINKRYKCKICNKVFQDYDLIVAHIELVHMQFENINEAKTQKFYSKNEKHNNGSNLVEIENENSDPISLQAVELVQLCNGSEYNGTKNSSVTVSDTVCIKNLHRTINYKNYGDDMNLIENNNNNNNYIDSSKNCELITQNSPQYRFESTDLTNKNEYLMLCNENISTNFINNSINTNSTINNVSKNDIIRDELKLQCQECNIKLNSITECHEHIKISHPYITKRYGCKFCPKSFKSASNRNQHERLHRETKDYHCLDCDKDFKTASQYINHKRTHAFRYECRECDKVYVYGQSLKHHYKNAHPESYENMLDTCSRKGDYECEICSKVYENRLSYLAHKRFDHNWAKIFKCREDNCNKKFFNKEQCDLHYKKKHAKEKSLKCQFCNKTFLMKCHLMVHMKKHTNEKNFNCEYCGKGFIQKVHLKTHLAKHTGLREFICNHQNCNKAFTSSTYLKKHKFIAHSEGSKKFKCNICDEGFPMLFVLNKHKKKHQK